MSERSFLDGVRLKPGADEVTVNQTLLEGLVESYQEDSVHEIESRITPTMSVVEQYRAMIEHERRRLLLLQMHVTYSGLSLIFGKDQILNEVEGLRLVEDGAVPPQFTTYVQWRLTNPAPPKLDPKD